MASYNGTVVLTGMISPTDTTDTYPTHEDILGKGGYMSVADSISRDSIPSLRRKEGMLVYQASDKLTYQLKGGINNSDWVVFSIGSSDTDITISMKLSNITITNALITDCFNNITIPSGEISFIKGNNGIIDSTLNFGILTEVLAENVNNDFIIVNDGVITTVYYNNLLLENNVKNIIDNYPYAYDELDLTTYTLSNKLSNILSQSHTIGTQYYVISGVMSRIGMGINNLEVLNQGEEVVVMFDGTSYSAYKKHNIPILDLQSRLIIG